MTFSPTSKQASCVARFSQVMQYLDFFSLTDVTSGLSVSKNLVISLHFANLRLNASNRVVNVIAVKISKNLALISLLSVITF